MKKCSVDGCDKPAKWRGMCSAHYQQWQRATPAERRPPAPGPSRHAALVGLFGGVRPFCRAVGIDPVTFYRWPSDAVPEARREDVLAGAARAGVDQDAVRAALAHG